MSNLVESGNLYELFGEISDLAYRFSATSRLVMLIQTAFSEGSNMPEQLDFDAMNAIYNQLWDLCAELAKLGEDVFHIAEQAADRDGAKDVLDALMEEYNAGLHGKPPIHHPPVKVKHELWENYFTVCESVYLRAREKATTVQH